MLSSFPVPPWPPDRPDLPGSSSPAEEPVASVGLESRNVHSGRHLETLQDRSGAWIDPPQVALVALPRAVPKISIDPGDPGDEAIGFDGAQDRAGLRVDLVDLAISILSYPERPLRPGEPRVAAAAGRWDRGDHVTGFRIDLLNAILGELKQVLAVEGRAGMSGDIERAQHLTAGGIQGLQFVAGGKPHILAVIRDASDLLDTGKGPVLTHNFSS